MQPGITGIHHVSITSTDVDASVAWYKRVFGLEEVLTEKHEGGYAVVLTDPASGTFIGIHRHDANDGRRFSETNTGLDHLSFGVAGREALNVWRERLERLGVEQSPITDVTDPFAYSVLVFRDPDGIQLELIAMGT